MNARMWSASIFIIVAACSYPVHAQEGLVLDTYTCGEFLTDVGDRANSAKLRRSLMMIAWAAGYAAARQKDATASLEVIAATLGDVCRNLPAEKAAKAIIAKIDSAKIDSAKIDSAKIDNSGDREAVMQAPSAPPVAHAAAAPFASAPAPASDSAERAFTAYSSRDMQGADYQKQRGISQDRCEGLCKQDSRCRAYAYDLWNRYCFLKSSVNPLRLEPRSITAVAGGAAVTYDDGEPMIQRRPQKAFPNAPYLQANAQNYGDCASRCLKDKRCEAFNFYQSARRCNLIEKPNEYSDDRAAEIGIKVQAAR